MNSNITIRKGNIEDTAAMSPIFKHYIRTSHVICSERERTPLDMYRLLAPVVEGGYPFHVAEVDGRIVGYCFAHAWLPDPVYAYCWELTEYLLPEAAGHGVGSGLLHHVIDDCIAGGAHSLVAFVTADNLPCCRMLARFGFSHIGTLPETGFKHGRWHGDAIYQLILPARK